MPEVTPETHPRYVVREGPPSYVVWDERAGKQVGMSIFGERSAAQAQCDQLNQSHYDFPTNY